ncbi:hypothetical protein [Pseudomonas retamae]|uniref:Uncharacterized protein n=1 Tax=Pseudomonas retamae TaxID=702110 RepID=A0ABW7D607_9PSED
MDQRNRKRHDDHAREGEVEIHGVFILSRFESEPIVNRRTAKKKFALLIPMIETIDGRCVCICPKHSLAFNKPATTSTNRHNHA